jgi:hypothetical protein
LPASSCHDARLEALVRVIGAGAATKTHEMPDRSIERPDRQRDFGSGSLRDAEGFGDDARVVSVPLNPSPR